MKTPDILRKKVQFEVGFLLLVLVLVLLLFWALSVLIGSGSDEETLSPPEEKTFTFSAVDTEETPLPGELSGIPVAVVIDNYSPIRSGQSGLSDATTVYESLVEGGITRLLAVFSGKTADRIGPVRSARSYYLDWAEEYGGVFVHAGGSPDALGTLRKGADVYDADALREADVFWKDEDGDAPHNTFTSTTRLLSRVPREDALKKSADKHFLFKDPDPDSGDIRHITIPFSTERYQVRYAYDSVDHRYERSNGGELHHDLKPSNVIVQFVEQEVIDKEGRLRLQTTGTGDALIFRDGKRIEGLWEKESGLTRFYDSNGNDIELNRGQTWIEVLPKGITVNYF